MLKSMKPPTYASEVNHEKIMVEKQTPNQQKTITHIERGEESSNILWQGDG